MKKNATLKIFRWSVSLLLALTVIAAALPRPAQASTDVVCAKSYTVKEGETIYRIARMHKVSVARLAKANQLTKPYSLVTGQSLCIPEARKLSTNFKWSATLKAGELKVTGTGFNKDYPIIVRVRESDTSAWYKLGLKMTDGKGALSAKYTLPKDLLKKPWLIVCLKDGVTDGLSCKKVWAQ